jgi:hypothetical protein
MLLLNHIDFDLGAEGRPVLAQILGQYPGVAVMASDHPELHPRSTPCGIFAKCRTHEMAPF